MRSVWRPGRPVDLRHTLGPLHRGCARLRFAGPTVLWATRTLDGPATVALHSVGATVEAEAWGPGAERLLAHVPVLLGRDDDWSGLDLTDAPALAEVRRRYPGMRLPATGQVFEELVPVVLEQRVTGMQARRSWRELLHRFGDPAPGPDPSLRVPPRAEVLLDVTTWQWHRLGVEQQRQRPIRAAATVAGRLDSLEPASAGAGLRTLPGIGVWTAAEVAQRAFGDPDAVSVGDFHVHDLVVFALTGRPRGTDDEMLDLLEPWAGQRQRIVRLIELSGVRKPRFGPRYSPLDIRAM
ncbi:MAG: DNA-3-methyladenine glycosylase 2 family protein [Actinobacteria bacterium]|nr:DNA-3-methyladenine glycosylase 2 family protein [Actinomycetota bacterium]